MKEPITREEFNDNYYIESTVISYQEANLTESGLYGDIEYGALGEVLETTGYLVVCREVHDTIYEYENDDEEGFIKAIKEEFNIIDL